MRFKDVAAEAGVSTGLVHYYFPGMDELVFAVHQRTVDDYIQRRTALLSRGMDPAATLREAIHHGLPSARQDEVFGLFYDLHSRGGRSGPHALLMASLWEQDVAFYSAVLEAGERSGGFALTAPAHSVATRLVALEDGLGLHVMSGNAAVGVEGALAVVLGYAEEATGACMTEARVATGAGGPQQPVAGPG